MLIFYQNPSGPPKEEIINSTAIKAIKSKSKCCKKHKEDDRCKRCPHYGLL